MLLRNGVCCYEYMDKLEKFNETSLPGKKDFSGNVNMEEITDLDNNHAKTFSVPIGRKIKTLL